MKKDMLEKFAEKHREEFDARIPSDKVWTRISTAIFGGHLLTFWNSAATWRAAATVLFGLSVYLFLSGPGMRTDGRMASQEFSDIESFYAAQITEKATLISNEDLFADDSYSQDIHKLEAMFTVLSEEMKKHPSEKVKDALVLNMIVRIDLMNQQIQKLEESRKKAKAVDSSI